MILSNKKITKALIRLRGCAGWSALLLFPNTVDRFSRMEAHIMLISNNCNTQIEIPQTVKVDCIPKLLLAW